MKWIVLSLIGILLMIFWPQGESGERGKSTASDTSSLRFPTSRSSRAISSTSKSSASRKSRLSEKEFENRVLELWPKIMSDLSGRDPAVVELIQILRELGKRDGPGALELLDSLERVGNESAWIRARVAVVGGWAINEPEAAAIALLKKDYVLPADFQKTVQRSSLGSHDPAHLAITRLASQIFERWAEISPERARKEALAQVQNGSTWNFGITGQLAAATSSHEEYLRSLQVNRNSIDAILNNPERTAPIFAVGTFQPPTEEMKNLGEPASTQGEWGARNPEHAIHLTQQAVNAGAQFYPEVVWGMARRNSNYQKLLELAPPEHRMRTAIGLVTQSGNSNDELVWQLDGNKTTWTMTPGKRHLSALNLLESENFSDDEYKILSAVLEEAKIRPPYSHTPRFILHDD